MRSLLKLLLVVILLGTAMQQGWLQAGTRFVASIFGAHAALTPDGGLDGMVVARGVGQAALGAGEVAYGAGGLTLGAMVQVIGALPDPWFTLSLMIIGTIALVLLVTLIRAAYRTSLWLSGRLRDVWV